MIQSFADKYRKPVSYFLFIIFYLQAVALPLHAAVNADYRVAYTGSSFTHAGNVKARLPFNAAGGAGIVQPVEQIKSPLAAAPEFAAVKPAAGTAVKPDIGGPSAPEASSFKGVGSDNLVNLFTGDFSYSIPLLDVGGYPVNLFYNGGITPEQEASWVGLGWNINPGTVSRGLRGVPDDFNGEDKLIQTQDVKPNRTWGGEVGIDGELIGRKKPNVNLSLGFSYNNYLGPAIDIGAGVSLTIPIVESVKDEKGNVTKDTSALSPQLGLNAKLSSRSGFTFSPSLNSSLPLGDKGNSLGAGISTSYNSRQGLKELNLNLTTSTSTVSKRDIAAKENNKDGVFGNSVSGSVASTAISFARPSYITTLRMPMQYSNYSGQLEIGLGMFGIRGSAHAQGYYSESKIPSEWKTISKPLVGFMYSEKANGNKNAVMDFNRLNDAEVTPNTPILSAPQYAYDLFTIQGEGTGGMIRAYRGDLGFMRDNETTSKDKNISIGADFAPSGHFGINWNVMHTPTRVGGWEDGNNTLIQTLSFGGKEQASTFENVYFRSPGEATITNSNFINRIGADNLVRFKLGGSDVSPRLESALEQFNKKTLSTIGEKGIDFTKSPIRDKRTQVTTMLTAAEAAQVGLEKKIRNYTGAFNNANTILYDSINRTDGFRKAHHISEIDVLEQTGMRYVYGLPVYNITQKDYTFSVGNIGDPNTGIVSFNTNEAGPGSPHMENKSQLDGYMMSQETPAYASSFLLTGLLSPDYVDVTSDGITEDDLGTAVKFDYQKSAGVHKWRTPRNNSVSNTAHFNEGLKSEKKDNKATISYGEREVWYLNAIESKSMVAIFKTAARNDAKGVISEMDGKVNTAENANKRLDQIDLYTKAEIKNKGINNARPIKTVHFNYSYSLCTGTPDNINGGGKLTLDSVYFSYNGQPRTKKDLYVFNYGNKASAIDNPSYANNISDKWGTYKNPAANPPGLTNAEYPYTADNKTLNDRYAAAWSLKKVLLPSGGQMEMQYEADDYGYVQDRRAANMYSIYGLGKDASATANNGLYEGGLPVPGLDYNDNFFVYIKLAQPLLNTGVTAQKQEILEKYLKGINQLAFKLMINMPKGEEPLTVYPEFEDFGLCQNIPSKDIIYVKLKALNNGESPLAKSAISFITGNLPGQAFPGYDVDIDNVGDFLKVVDGMLYNLKNAFNNVDVQMRSSGPPKARTIVLSKSFVRLDNPSKTKYGGGARVKRVLVRDNWNKMTNQFTSTYGQDYDYTTTEKIDGKDAVISSGVASYETGIGSEENPFREIVSFSNKMPLASAEYGAIEMPMLEGLFPSPGVGYSKVTVRSIHRKGTHGDSTLRSAIGKQVTEFYTARDYPTKAAYTPISGKEYHRNTFFNIFYKDITDRKVLSQGFLVETNDMHGKIKSQAAYSESDEKMPLTASYYTYKNTGANGLNDKIDFVSNELGGAVVKGNMGIDMELMTDVRESSVQTSGINGQLQTDFFTFAPWPIFVLPKLFLKTYTESKYRAVTCTKLINYHAIEDSVVVMDKGSVISTKTIAYDAETGTPVVTKTANEFNDPVYNVSYPAYWAYSGMQPAYKNIDLRFMVNFNDGRISLSPADQNKYFESGDELYLYVPGQGVPTGSCLAESPTTRKLWAFDLNKNNTALTVLSKDLVFLDSAGNLFTKKNVGIRIIRSGKRNLIGNTAASLSQMSNPIAGNILAINSNSKVVASSAAEYKEKWHTDPDVIRRTSTTYDPVNCIYTEVADCAGMLEKKINPYVKGLLGNFRSVRGMVFYEARNEQINTVTTIRKNGYLSNYSNYWDFNGNNNLVPAVANTKWVWNNEVTKFNSKGLELETKNALNIYTSAQYGYNKTLPLAVTNNARYTEMGADNFEDGAYIESINNSVFSSCSDTKHLDMAAMPNTLTADSDTLSFGAHTGKKMLSVLPQTNWYQLDKYKTFPISAPANDNFSMNFTKDTTRVLTDPGVNIYDVVTNPVNPSVQVNEWYINAGGFEIHTVEPRESPGGPHPSQLDFKTKHYFKIATQGVYKLSLECRQETDMPPQEYDANMTANIYDTNHVLIETLYCNIISPSNNPYGIKNVCLKPGIYYVTSTVHTSVAILDPNPSQNIEFELVYTFKVQTLPYVNIPTPSYKTTDTQDGCIFNKPVAGVDTMINPGLSFIPGTIMLFSSWVKEGCSAYGNGNPCTVQNFAYSNALIKFEDDNGAQIGNIITVSPSGSIIEGWQKVEGDFTVPINAKKMKLGLKNSSGYINYWDDVRIMPYNANMKTYAYDAANLRLTAELDENNYASFYEYDEEGKLVRIKKETARGIKTITETRSAKQTGINNIEE